MSSSADDESGVPRHLVPLLVLLLAVVVLGGITDLVLDRPTRWWTSHVLVEVAVIAASLLGAAALGRGWWRANRLLGDTRQALRDTTRSLADRQREAESWRDAAQSARREFATAVDAQFRDWGLTPTEREIAFLLLQGHGHKQIAARTGRSERTVRQHAVSVYGKSGIGGRAELAAYFLHDLLPPDA
ncbi:MAG: LuxR C-terminal-related transcriptional regulator [Gemmatimonadetes bacterium]|nr:LuxR C-terminal-related transcriptional regulator [Gemmatimonadota bacterium]